MKIIAFLIVFACTSAWSKSVTHNEYMKLSPDQKTQILVTYIDFLKKIKEEEATSATNLIFWNLISSAFADENYDCVYSGWPSKRINGRCSSPIRNNHSYGQQSSSCSGNQLLCQPLLFGPNLCAKTSTQSQRNSAFAQCQTLATAANRTPASIAQSLSSPALATEADELFQTVERICQTGFQASTGMCRRLEQQVAEIRESRPQVVEQVEPVATAVTGGNNYELPVVTAEIRSNLDPLIPKSQSLRKSSETIEALVPGIELLSNPSTIVSQPPTPTCAPLLAETVTPQPIRVPAHSGRLFRHVLNRDNNVPVILCPQAPQDLTDQNYNQLINDYNISFYPDRSTVIQNPHFRDFIFELNKFPRHLLLEMASRNGGIRLIDGTNENFRGIIGDTLRTEERDRNIRIRREQERFNRDNPRQAISLDPSLSVEAIQRSYEYMSYGRTYAEVSGSGGVFQDPCNSIPTRVAVNELYERIERMPSGVEMLLPQGTTNLFLHEHGHALDNLYGYRSISSSSSWRTVLANSQTEQYIQKILTPYEHRVAPDNLDDSVRAEGFAELFSYYYSCGAARQQMEANAPALANFFANLNMRTYRGTTRPTRCL